MVLPPGYRGDFTRVSGPHRFRTFCYAIEGINSFATVIYFNYLYFYCRDHFGFNDRQNLTLAAFVGSIYVIAAWQGGKFAHRFGYFNALKIGFALMAVGLAAGLGFHTVIAQIALACMVNAGQCFIWPVLEALVSEGPAPARAVGIYNITWAISNAAAYFIGGTLIEKFGYQSIFILPLALMILQFCSVFWLQKMHAALPPAKHEAQPDDEHRPLPALAKKFQAMAWLSNPFAYIGINTLIAVLPGIAAKFKLSAMEAGFMCSLWCFARVVAFVVLWKWPGWHYRFRYLLTAFVLLILSFAVILMSPALTAVVVAQIFFGLAVGLMYYSSLYYAMHVSEAKSEHGGIHEAAIGVGNCLGPAAGAVALWLAPQSPTMGAWAVSGLLTVGLGGLVWLKQKPTR